MVLGTQVARSGASEAEDNGTTTSYFRYELVIMRSFASADGMPIDPTAWKCSSVLAAGGRARAARAKT